MLLVQMSVAGGVLIGLIALVRSLALHRLPKTTFPALWWVAVLRLLVPVFVPLPVGLSAPLHSLPSFAARTGVGLSALSQSAAVLAAEENTTVSAQTATHGSTFLWIWLGGVFLFLIYFCVVSVRSFRRFSLSVPDDTPYVRVWLEEHPLRRPLAVRTCERISSPLTYGVLRPVILLPKDLDRSDETALSHVLLHESVHIRRLDAITKILFALTLCLHWLNPLVWVLFFLGNRDLELSCDARVLQVLGEGARAAYARTLIGLAEKKTTGVAPVSSFSNHAITERIRSIMKFKKKTAFAVILALVLVLSATVAFAFDAPSAADADYAPKADIVLAHKGYVSTSNQSAMREPLVIEGDAGKRFVSGDLVFEIVSEEEIRQASSEHQTRASTKLWTIPLSGDALSKDFSVTSSYPYAKVWIQNSGTGNIVFTITKNSPTGTLVTGSNVTVAANTSISVYSTNPWPAATYYANFTSGHVNMLGTSSCRIASTISELDI